MPQIPTFVAPTPTPIPASQARFSPEAAAAPAEAAARSAAGLEKFAQDIANLQVQRDTQYYNEQIAEARNLAFDRYQADREEAQQTGNYEGFAQRQREALEKDVAR